MELKLINSFVAVVDSGSFSSAAKILNLTQSAVSLHVKTLEEQLDTTLMIRSARSICLTESGKALYDYSRRMLRQVEECKEHISNINGCLRGELHIGVGSFIEPYIRQAAVVMMNRHPGIKLNVDFGKSCQLNRMLRSHNIDLAFTMNESYSEEGIETLPCIPFRIEAIMGSTHPLASQEKVSYEDILRHPVIMPDAGDRVFATIGRYFDGDISRFDVRAAVNSPEGILGVLNVMGAVSFMPSIYVSGRKDLVSRPIIGLERDLVSNAHRMKDVPLKASSREFLSIIHNDIIPNYHI